jgi:F0F1-type ATP synthase membrane subunit b/b'
VRRLNRLVRSLDCLAVAFSVFSFFLIAAPAMAEEAATRPENSQAGWIFRWINFAIVLAAIVYFFAKVAAPSLRTRSDEIAQKIAEGSRAREAAEKQRRDVQAKLAGIDAEVAKLREEAKRSTEAEAVRLKTLARQEAEIIERAAQAEIVAAQRAATLEMKALAARLAIERAETVLAGQITPAAQASLFHTFVTELDRSAN